MPRFKSIFTDRGFKENIILIPGWATDARMFEKLDIPYNYCLLENALTKDFTRIIDDLPDKIKSFGLNILGWSLGGFIAADIVSRYPLMFNKVILVSIRRKYDKKNIDRIRNYLIRNAKAYLCKFYGSLFSETEKDNEEWFKNNLLKDYLKNTDLPYLFDGLEYLANKELKSDFLKGPDIIFVHGENDKIASLDDARIAAVQVPCAKFIAIKNAGHFPILRKEFKDIFSKKAC